MNAAAFIVVLAILIAIASCGELRDDAAVVTGNCSESVKWVLNKTSTKLIITGKGDISCSSFSSSMPGWYNYTQYIYTVDIGEEITSIGNHSFYECKNLTSIILPQSLRIIGKYAFYGCSELQVIVLPQNLETIGGDAFHGCSKLQVIEIPHHVSLIGNYTFYGCTDLKIVRIRSTLITSIKPYTFYDCFSLTSVNIPSSVQTIGEYAFYRCESLTSIIIPSSVIIIDSFAFYKSGLTSVIIPPNVIALGNNIFTECNNLSSVKFLSKLVTSIQEYTFSGCTSLTNVNIPSSIKTIGPYAFQNCKSLTNIVIPSSVTTIKTSAFYGCINLTSVVIPSSVSTIGHESFLSCSKLKTIVYQGQQEPNYTGTPFNYRSSVESIIVPLNYNSSHFCGFSNLCKSSLCNQINNCYELIDCGKSNETVQKRSVAQSWEHQSSNGCFEYQCVNETGNAIISKCNSDSEHGRICDNGECVVVDNINYFQVVIDTHPIIVDELIVSEIQTTISSASGVEASKIKIGVEISEGVFFRIIVFVDDEQTAKSIEKAASSCIQ